MPAKSAQWVFVLIAGVYGLILGSFFNVLVWRVPRGESIVKPGSRCPRCARPLTWYENIPVISYLIQRGKCRGCTAPISLRYPVVEIITALATMLLWVQYAHFSFAHLPPLPLLVQTLGAALILLILIPLSLIDIDHLLLPFSFTIPILASGGAIAFLPGGLTPLEMLLGVAAGAGPLLAIGYIGSLILKKEAMGGGDIWLMAGLGAWFGWQNALLTIMFGSVAGALTSLVLMPLKVIGKDHVIPFGPFLALGAWVAVLRGEAILDWYFGLTLALIR